MERLTASLAGLFPLETQLLKGEIHDAKLEAAAVPKALAAIPASAFAAEDASLGWLRKAPRELWPSLPAVCVLLARLRLLFDLMLELPLPRGPEGAACAAALRDFAFENADSASRLLCGSSERREAALAASALAVGSVCLSAEALNALARCGVCFARLGEDGGVVEESDEASLSADAAASRLRRRRASSSSLAFSGVSSTPQAEALSTALTVRAAVAASRGDACESTPRKQSKTRRGSRRPSSATLEATALSTCSGETPQILDEALRSTFEEVGGFWVDAAAALLRGDEGLSGESRFEEAADLFSSQLNELVNEAGEILSSAQPRQQQSTKTGLDVSSASRGQKSKRRASHHSSKKRRRRLCLQKGPNPRESDWEKSPSSAGDDSAESDDDFTG